MSAHYSHLSRDAKRASFERIAETCPKVDAFAASLRDSIREDTDKDEVLESLELLLGECLAARIALREALTACEQERLAAEDRVNDLEASHV